MNVILTIILILLVIVILIYWQVKKKLREFSSSIFGTSNIIEGIKNQKIALTNEPKSVFGMEKLLLPNIVKDFPNLNINEMKKMVEDSILMCLQSIEKKQVLKADYVSEAIINWIQSRIDDLNKEEFVNYDAIKFHRTVLSQYTNKDGVYALTFQTAVEYLYKKNDTNYEKIQNRFNTEFIYIFDDTKVSKYQSGIALNCPNCGAPIKDLGVKICNYCGTGVIDLVKKTWILNNIKES